MPIGLMATGVYLSVLLTGLLFYDPPDEQAVVSPYFSIFREDTMFRRRGTSTWNDEWGWWRHGDTKRSPGFRVKGSTIGPLVGSGDNAWRGSRRYPGWSCYWRIVTIRIKHLTISRYAVHWGETFTSQHRRCIYGGGFWALPGKFGKGLLYMIYFVVDALV